MTSSLSRTQIRRAQRRTESIRHRAYWNSQPCESHETQAPHRGIDSSAALVELEGRLTHLVALQGHAISLRLRHLEEWCLSFQLRSFVGTWEPCKGRTSDSWGRSHGAFNPGDADSLVVDWDLDHVNFKRDVRTLRLHDVLPPPGLTMTRVAQRWL